MNKRIVFLLLVAAVITTSCGDPKAARTAVHGDIELPQYKNSSWFHLNGAQSIFWIGNDEIIYVGHESGKLVEYNESTLMRWKISGKPVPYNPERKRPKILCINKDLILYSANDGAERRYYRGVLGEEEVYFAERGKIDREKCTFERVGANYIPALDYERGFNGPGMFSYGRDLTPKDYQYKDFWWPNRDLLFAPVGVNNAAFSLGVPEREVISINYYPFSGAYFVPLWSGVSGESPSALDKNSRGALWITPQGEVSTVVFPVLGSSSSLIKYMPWKSGYLLSKLPEGNATDRERGVYVNFERNNAALETAWHRVFYGNTFDMVVSPDGCSVAYSGEDLVSSSSGSEETKFISAISLCDLNKEDVRDIPDRRDAGFVKVFGQANAHLNDDEYLRVGVYFFQVPKNNIRLWHNKVQDNVYLKLDYDEILPALSESAEHWQQGIFHWVPIKLEYLKSSRIGLRQSYDDLDLLYSSRAQSKLVMDGADLVQYLGVKYEYTTDDRYMPLSRDALAPDRNPIVIRCDKDVSRVVDVSRRCQVSYMMRDRLSVTYYFHKNALPYWKDIHQSVVGRLEGFLQEY